MYPPWLQPVDPKTFAVDVRQGLEVVHGAQRVVDLVAAVVDRVVVGLAITGTAAILGTDDDVTPLDSVSDEGKHVDSPVTMHAAVNPHHGRMSAWPAQVQRLKKISRDIHAADAAAIRDFLEVQHALAGLRIAGIGSGFLRDIALEVVSGRVVSRIVADVELSRPSQVDCRLWTRHASRGRRAGCGGALPCCAEPIAPSVIVALQPRALPAVSNSASCESS